MQQVGDGVRELVAVGHGDRRDGERIGEPERLAGLVSHGLDVVELHELAPRAVGLEVVGEAWRRVHGDRPRVHDLEAEVCETEVVADVGVRQQHAVDRLPIDSTPLPTTVEADVVELFGDVRRRVDQEDSWRVGGSVRRHPHRETRHSADERRIHARPLATRTGAGGVRYAAVLRRAEHLDPDPPRAIGGERRRVVGRLRR